MTTRFAVVTLWAEDVAASAHFYRDVLELQPSPHLGPRPHFRVDGVYLVILKGTPAQARDTIPARFPLFALAVDDLDERVRRLEKHGIELPWGIETDADGRWIMFHDPAGNLIELAEFNS